MPAINQKRRKDMEGNKMNYYAKAIEILCTWDTEDMKDLMGKIAEKNPGLKRN